MNLKWKTMKQEHYININLKTGHTRLYSLVKRLSITLGGKHGF